METVDELTAGTSIADGLWLRVISVDWDVSGRRAIVTAEDFGNNRIRLIDFEGANLDHQWQQDQVYEVSDCQVAKGSDGYKYQLEPSKRSTVELVGHLSSGFRIFVLGDTHVGYRNRADADKKKAGRNTDCREVFLECLNRARSQRADIVVHAGDVFDHENTKHDREVVIEAIDDLARDGIPFCYIYGNHDDEKAKNALEASRGIHLDQVPKTFDDRSIRLIGIDHTAGDFPDQPSVSPKTLHSTTNIVVIHETPYPILDDVGQTIYDMKVGVADIAPFFDNADFPIDYLIAGHQHLPRVGSIVRSDTEVLVTGSPASLRSPDQENPFSTWMVRVSGEESSLERHPL